MDFVRVIVVVMNSYDIHKVKRFINRVSDIPVDATYSNHPSLKRYAAVCTGISIEPGGDIISGLIYLSRRYFMYSNPLFKKALLMHEVGHLHVTAKCVHKKEMYVHKWAIDKADSLGWTKIRDKLIYIITEEWPGFNWITDSGYRVYIMASKLYKETYDGKYSS